MGWGSGSGLMEDIIRGLKRKALNDATRRRVYHVLVPVFLNADCDTLYELEGMDPVFDKVLKRYAVEPADTDNTDLKPQ